MGIVRFALKFPHTFFVLAALILVLGVSAILSMSTDIFPEINIPVVTVIWQETGLSTPEMEQRVTTYSQYSISTSVNGILDIEAQTLNGISIQKLYFQPDVDIDLAIAQIVAATNSIRALMPPGIQPPTIVRYDASSVPVLQISLSSDTLNGSQLYDYGIYRMRQQLAPIHGVTLPTPAGGKYRQIMVDIDPLKLQAKGLTPNDVVNAVNAQAFTVPSGTAKLGDKQYTVRTNALPSPIDDLNNIATVFIKDVGEVHDGWLVQQNVVRTEGTQSVLLSIIKNGNASTLAVVNAVKEALKTARAAAPSGMQIAALFDQSVFVKDSIIGLLREGAIAAALTALMIILFLGSWRSTFIVMVSIPLSILSSLVVLYFLGETINTMTLGGLALAIGILVDDSTVTIENTHRYLSEEKMPLPQATLHGSANIAVPTLVSTLAISCVFTSVVFLTGPAKFLFTPMGLAVVFAMLASYALSRTLTPILIGYLLKGEHHGEADAPRGLFARFNAGFNRGFERFRASYADLLGGLVRHRFISPAVAGLILILGGVLFIFVGRYFFPAIAAGQIQLHVRAPPGTRIEKTTQIFQAIENKIRQTVPESDRDIVVDNIGLPARTYNYAFMDGTAIGVNDGVILVALKEGHAPTADYVKKLRQALPAAFPEEMFYFQPADIATQILNFGIPTQIDVRTVGYDRTKNLAVAKDLRRRVAAIPGLVDVHLQQELDGPDFLANIDRARATQFGLTASGIANDINISLSSSEQVTPNFWTDPTSGIPYYLAVQTPQYLADSLNEIKNTPIGAIAAPVVATTGMVPGLLSNVATFTRDTTPTNLNQANIQPVYEVFANTQGRDLGSVSSDINRIIADEQKQMRPGNSIQVVGQMESMNSAFQNMSLGLVFAAIFVYLLMVVNYQTWADPFVVILALPATLCGALTMLFITGTTLSVPSLMGMIMAVGVASANSILLVTYARDEQLAGKPALEAAVEAGVTRIRPVLMTATAMIVGMLPMAIGEPGGEQNAALARAVVGGLLFATPTTLLLVPYLFATLRRGADGKVAHGVFAEGLE